ncbi:hypothetical protein [Caulobacter sp. FWC2]|uniref:DUF6968 family protein n=1 Tax=Caulobacter sp. FWC2 TaxID=69664 RepID=UPI000C15097C|nr:hypothetical protein [Caulobacter sp. FWC2]PIB92655.1 hypothetical protein CSW62_14430 [Caulobacter sp. FWC2]
MSDALQVPLAEGVACERTYWIVMDGEPRPLFIRWLQPQPMEVGWECPVQTTWPDGRVRIRRIGGEDSAQALFLAFCMVGSELIVSKNPVYWFDLNDDLGLPMLSAVADVVAERKARFEAK